MRPASAQTTFVGDFDTGFASPLGYYLDPQDPVSPATDTNDTHFYTGELLGDGSIIAGGRHVNTAARGDFYVRKFTASGAVDTAFGTNGFVRTNSAFGDIAGKPVPLRRNEFLPDTQKISEGVIVNQGDWELKLEQNKQAFAAEFVTRARFIAAFPSTMTATEFVDKLNQNAGGALNATERAQLIAELGSTPADTQKRASVLRKVAEDQTLRDAEFRKASVLMQYFGYLQRDPDAAPDTNFDGLQLLAREAQRVRRRLREGRDGQGIHRVSRVSRSLRHAVTDAPYHAQPAPLHKSQRGCFLSPDHARNVVARDGRDKCLRAEAHRRAVNIERASVSATRTLQMSRRSSTRSRRYSINP